MICDHVCRCSYWAQEQVTQISYTLISGGQVMKRPKDVASWNTSVTFLRISTVPSPSTPTYIDYQACIAKAKMPVFSEKQKHIAIRVCHLRKCCWNKMVELRPIGTRFEVADIGNNALPEPAFVDSKACQWCAVFHSIRKTRGCENVWALCDDIKSVG